MAVTQKDIAEHLGLSRSVVALALNGYGRVADETRQRVRDAAQELGYDANSNLAARSLIAKRHDRPVRTGVLAVMTSKLIQGHGARDLPFYADLLDGIESTAIQSERDVFICAPRLERLPRFIVNGMVDGVIVFDTDTLELLRSVDVPTLLVSMPFTDVDFLAPAEKDGMYKATRHLIELGHRHIIFLGFNDGPASANRAAGYQLAMEELSLPFRIHECDGADVASAAKMEELLGVRRRALAKGSRNSGDPTSYFTAVVCRNDLIGMSAIKTMEKHGLRVPDDISVVGFDDVTPQYNFHPTITSLRFDRYAMGKRAVELLCHASDSDALFKGKGRDGYSSELFETELVLRESTARPKT